ncbi:MAG: penicillin-binding protein 1C [Bacteroidetes bacterium]|nr:penicillin-binding protein 1C [Bacteroidota bacterium]
MIDRGKQLQRRNREQVPRRILAVCIVVLLTLGLLDQSFPPPAPPPFSTQVFDRDGELLGAFLSDDDKWRLRTRLDHLPPEMITAVLQKEDRWFSLHPGVNVPAVLRALYTNLIAGERVSGASTITMQVARMLEPDDRTYAIKLREMIRALQLERRYSKREILELYVSLLPMGGNIEGVASASWIYFQRPPARLSLAQCAALAVLPNDPNLLRLDRSADPLQRRTREWLRRFRDRGVFPASVVNTAMEETFTVARNAPPLRAPHYCQRVRRRSGGDLRRTTIDAAVQDAAERLLANHVQRVVVDGVSNGAVLVIRNDGMDVAAYCGSADYDDAMRHGQVDGIGAVRSPGSTLKPFLYARAFEDGSLTPLRRLADIPTDFGGYTPENFDTEFRGEVTVEEALLQSLNIPAVRELARQGAGPFVSWLARLGFRDIAERREHLGLSLILGGCGATLEELTRAFSILARDGRLSPLRFETDDLLDAGQQMLSVSAAFLITDILSKHERPDIPLELLAQSRLPEIAWKTGTSYGKRDAWAIGWNARYTIGVWMGNFNGEGAPHLSGAVMAVPLLVDLFNAIDTEGKTLGITRPREVRQREVCVRSGMLPSPQCAETVQDWYIVGTSSRAQCHLMQLFHVDAARSLHYCMECLPDSGTEEVWYPVYAAELALWFAENGVGIPRPPPHNPACTARFSGEGPSILSPSADYTYYLERGTEQEILLHAASPAGTGKHYWYVDGTLYVEAEAGERVFFRPSASSHRITCMDDAGRKQTVPLRIVYY